MLIACYMVYMALNIKNSNFAKIKCFVVIILAIQNLTEYLNRNYISDKNLEEEVSIMTKSLYDPEVEKRGIEKLFSKLSNKTQYVLLGVYILFLLITAILSYNIYLYYLVFVL